MIHNSLRLALPLLLVLAGCGGGGGDGAASIRVLVRGTVDSLAGQGGTVSIIAGGTTVTAPVAADGSYQATLETDRPSDFVALRALGTGQRSRAEFESLLGSAQSVKDAAGADGELRAGEEPKVDLNSYQTAVAAILRKIGGGGGKAAPISVPNLSDAELATLQSQVDPAQALTLGAALELGVKNRAVDFPDEFGTTLELALDQEAAGDYVETQVTQNATAFQEEVAALADVAGQTIGFTAANLPALAHFATVSSITTQDGDQFQFRTNGTGTLELLWSLDPQSDNQTEYQWTTQGGKALLTLNPPLTGTATSVFDAGGNLVVTDCTQTLSAIALQPIAVTANGTSVIADYTASQTCPARSDLSGSISFTRLGQFVASEGFIPYSTAEVTAAPLTADIATPDRPGGSGDAARVLDSDILTFNANGTGTAAISGQTFTWSIVGGELRAAFSSGASAIYRKLFPIAESGQHRIASRIELADGHVFPTASSSSPARNPGFTSVPGDYHQNGVGTEGCVGQISEFVIRLEPDQGAFQVTFANAGTGDACAIALDGQGQPLAPVLFTRTLRPWRLDGVTGELVLERTFDDATGEFDNCDPATTQTCYVQDQRRVRRLSVSGDREFWFETRRIPCQVTNSSFCGASPIEDAPADHLVRFYDKRPAGSFAPGKRLAKAGVTVPFRPAVPRGGWVK